MLDKITNRFQSRARTVTHNRKVDNFITNNSERYGI